MERLLILAMIDPKTLVWFPRNELARWQCVESDEVEW